MGEVGITAYVLDEARLRVKDAAGRQMTVAGPATGAPSDAIDAERVDFSPMELVLVALATCLGLSIAPVLRKMRLEVTAYELRVRGTKREAYPQVYTAITIEHRLRGRALPFEQVRRAVALGEEKYCGVSAMLGAAVPLTSTVLVEDEIDGKSLAG